MAKVTFEDKVGVREIDLPAVNVIRADDITELKNSINSLYDQSVNVVGVPNAGDKIQYNGVDWIPVPAAASTTGAVISFANDQVYNTPASPATGNITNDLTGARIGVVQKIYHNSGSTPTVPAGWVLIGSGTYQTSTLNIIYAEWVSGTRVEYWIVQ